MHSLSLKGGLAYMKSFGPPSDQNLTSYHHAIFTYPEEWDPSVLDHEYSADCRILGLTALNSLLQYVNGLVWEVCSVN